MHEWQDPQRFLKIISRPEFHQLVVLQDGLHQDSTAFWSDRSVISMHLPLTTFGVSSPMGLGSDSLPLEVEIAGKKCYLADSMQFMLEYGCRFNPAGAWYLMPSFRAEPADEMHLNQFFHSEAEIPGTFDDIMNVVEDYLRVITARALDRMRRIPVVGQDTSHIEAFLKLPALPRINFDEAASLLGNNPDFIELHESWRTITRPGERRLIAELGSALWLTNFEHLAVPFYQAYSDNQDPPHAANADLLCGLGEMVGAGERHATGDQVVAALQHHEVDHNPYHWYIALKNAYPMQTAGFGLGVERWLQWLTRTSDIRNLQLIPRIHGYPAQP